MDEAFAYNLGSGQDIGASVAIAVDGELVIGLGGGYLDTTYMRPWARHTIVWRNTAGLLVDLTEHQQDGKGRAIRKQEDKS